MKSKYLGIKWVFKLQNVRMFGLKLNKIEVIFTHLESR